MHLPLQEVQEKTTSTEFLEWREYFEIKQQTVKPDYYYLAQIALEIRRSWIKATSRKNLKLADFFFKFVPRGKQPVTKADKTQHVLKSKAAWLGAVGFGKAKKKK